MDLDPPLRPSHARPLTPERLLTRLFRLDIWGTSLLTPKVEENLAAAYALLLVVGLWEWFSAGLLAAFLFGGGVLKPEVLPFAVPAGLLWALAVMMLDKTLLTMDLDGAGRAAYSAFAGRVLIVLIGAVFTARPIDHWVARAKVVERLEEEQKLAHAVDMIGEDENLEGDYAGLADATPEELLTRRGKALESLDAAVTVAREAQSQAALAVTLAEARVRAHRASLAASRAASPPDANEVGRRDASLIRSQGTLAAANVALAAARAVTADAEARRDAAAARFDDAMEAEKQARKTARGEVGAAREQLRSRLDEADPVTLPRDFYTYEAVLDDLRMGRTPRWPERADMDARTRAKESFGLEYPVEQEARPSTTSYWFAFWSVGISVIFSAIPLAAVAFKVSLDPATRRYFSTRAQAAAGHPDAWRSLEVEASFEGS